MSRAITFCLVIVGVINFLPVFGLFGASKLQTAYGIALVSDELLILMRHRALLFGIIGGFILYAAFVRSYQLIAMIMAAVSMVGFVVLTYGSDGYNAQIKTVLNVDLLGIGFLIVAMLLKANKTARP